MDLLRAYIRPADGSVQDFHIQTKVKKVGNVSAVYADGFSGSLLDADFGAGIDFTISDVKSWMADFRHTEVWCMPAFGEKLSDIPDETQGLICQKEDKRFAVVLPVVSKQYKCVLKGSENGAITAKLLSRYGGLSACRALAFVYAEGENPYALLKEAAKTALTLLGNGCRIREDRRYPEVFEYLGWCSWDAMEIRVCEEDLLKKCEELEQKNIPVKWAILDDMWGEVHDFYGVPYKDRTEMFRLMHASRLYSFRADPIRFPNGLSSCIRKMKAYGMQIGIWHPTTGYWKGIDPDGDINREHRDLLVCTEDGQHLPSFHRDKAYLFYSAFHDELRACGADFVKIDNQSVAARYRGMAPVGEVARGLHDAIEASVGQHFDNAMINCMGMANEDMWNRSVSAISRCSDDFQPEDSAWFTKHIMQCSYNCLIQGQFYYGDWDMWWTDDGQAIKNSVLRAISGGPIYVSDKLGRSNREVLMPLIFEDGRILRCDRPAMPTADCLTKDPTLSGKIFKLQNICGDSGVVAVFHIDRENRSVDGTLSPSEIDGLKGDRFAVYEYFSKELTLLNREDAMAITLQDINEFKLYIVAPIRDGFAAIGRIDKFIAPKTIRAVRGREVELIEDGPYAVVEDERLVIKS